MNVLADTSVWIDHFRSADLRLAQLILEDRLLMHPVVIGELACGNLSRRDESLLAFQRMPVASVAEAAETLVVVESRKLWGKGIGWSDAQLVASALLSGCKLWTLDRNLSRVATTLGIALEHFQ